MMEWYKTLGIHQRITAKECFVFACGVGFQEVGLVLSFEDRINVLYNKLKDIGFDIK